MSNAIHGSVTIRGYWEVLSADGFVGMSGCSAPAGCDEGAVTMARDYLAKNHANEITRIKIVRETTIVSEYTGRVSYEYSELPVDYTEWLLARI